MKPQLGTQVDYSHPLAKGLVGCWFFNERHGDKVLDSTGNKNRGTINNMSFPATVTSGWNPGKFGSVPMYDGTNDYIIIASTPILDLTKFSISVWVVLSSTDTTVYRTIISKSLSSTNRNFWLSSAITTGLLHFRFSIGAVSKVYTTAFVMNDNKWHHIVVTFDNSNLKLYADGNIVSTAAAPGLCDMPATDTYIGTQPSTSNHWVGIIDNLLIFNRALVDSEVKSHYIDTYEVLRGN